MKFSDFRDCVILQRLADLFQFNENDKKTLHIKCYENMEVVSRQLSQFKKYLMNMENRNSQRIPKEQLHEFFGGKQDMDVIIPGIGQYFIKYNPC